jgi:RES domain-containing protein
MPFRYVRRHGTYYRVCKADWAACSDTSYAKQFGGRWTPPEEFGALYLCATIEVAAAVARTHHVGRAIPLFSLRPSRRPQLQSFTVTASQFVDVVTNEGVAATGLPATFPFGVDHKTCWPIARQAYSLGERAIASRAAAECGPDFWLGEELAVFDNGPMPRAAGRRRPFSQWYPDVVPPLGS